MFLRDIQKIRGDLQDLTQDPVFKAHKITINDIPWEMFPDGFHGLVRIVLGQQVSTKAADAMWAKTIVSAGSLDRLSPEWFLNQEDESLKTLGFSRQKIKYIRQLSENILCNNFDLDVIGSKTCEKKIEKSIKSQLGFGQWSADIYRMFCLGHRDVLPQNDLALNRGAMVVHDLKDTPKYIELQRFAEPFDGRRTAYSLLVWQCYTQGVTKIK